MRALLSLVLLASIVLGACSTTPSPLNEGLALIDAGRFNEGFARLDEAFKADPRNAETRAAVLSSRAIAIGRLLDQAQNALYQQRVADAEKLFRAVLRIDEQNAMALGGLDNVAAARRQAIAVKQAEDHFKKNSIPDALDVLRGVFAENPQNKEAADLLARIQEKQNQDKEAAKKKASASTTLVSLDFRDTALSAVFDVLAKQADINVFYDKDVKTEMRVSMKGKNMPVDEAIRLLLMTNQLEQRFLNAKSILVYPSTPQKQKDYQPMSVRSFYLTNADAKQVAATFKTILKARDVVVNEKLNVIIIRDTPEIVQLAEKLLAMEDVGEPEVMLEVEVLEIQRSKLLDLGVQWPTQLSLSVPSNTTGASGSNGTTPSTSNSFTLYDLLHLNTQKVNAALPNMVINAQNQDTDSKLLANPRIRVKNKEKAKIMIGDRVPVITTTSTATGFVSGNINYIDVGLKLEVEPNIFLNREVAIKLGLEVSSIVNQVTTTSGNVAYQIGTRNASTVLQLKDGETQILGGLINDQDAQTADKVPGLGSLPILGRLFSNQNNSSKKTEIVLAITPRLVRMIQRTDLVRAEFDSGTDSNLGSKSLSLPLSRAGEEPKGAATNAVTGTSTSASPGGERRQIDPARLTWSAPTQLRTGEQFSASLQYRTQDLLTSMPMVIAFDPDLLQVVAVNEGDYFRQAGGGEFNSRVDAQSGQIYIDATGPAVGAAGAGSLVSLTFKALKPATRTGIRLMSAQPVPPAASSFTLPLTHSIGITD